MAVSGNQRTRPRNPGPPGGYWLLLFLHRWLPTPVYRLFFRIGVWIAVATLPTQRRQSQRYLKAILGRPVGLGEVHRHFSDVAETLVAILLAGRGHPHPIRWAEGEGADFEATLRASKSVLLGTFHMGHSDLLGYHLNHFGLKVSMVRIRVGNSADTQLAEKRFGRNIGFIWVDAPENITFAIKTALEAGDSLAMKCDRIEGARKTERFRFLGRETTFPFTIYYFSRLFSLPVLFAFGLSDGNGGSICYSPPVFNPCDKDSRETHLAKARDHFRMVLTQAEALLRQNRFAWHNFLPDPEETGNA